MPARTDLEAGLKCVLDATKGRLRPLGFKKRGALFVRIANDVSTMVQFQRSTTNTRDRLTFTVNLGIAVGALLYPGQELSKMREWDGHLRMRLGELLPDRADKWWTLDGSQEPQAVANEVARAIAEIAVPYFDAHGTADAMQSLWESGRSPGLTDRKRDELLARLRARSG